MAIKHRNIHKNYTLAGVFATAAAFLADARNAGDAEAGDFYYDSTLGYFRQYNGTVWSPIGTSGIGPGSLDAAANLGAKITIDGAMTAGVEIEATDAMIATNGTLLMLDNNDTGADVHCLECTNAGTGPSIIIAGQAASDDIQGTSDAWAVTSAGVATFTGVGLADSVNLTFGTGGDVTVDYVDGGTPGTAGAGLLFAHTASDDNIQFGNATHSFDVLFIGDTATTNYMQWDLNGGAGSVGALVFDNTDIDLGDSDLIRFGDSADVTVGYADTNDNFVITHGGRVSWGTDGTGMDMYIYSATAGNYLYWDETSAILDVLDVKVDLDDESILRFGSSNDMTMQYIGASSLLRIAGDNLRLDFGVSGAGFDMYWMTEDTGDYIYWDEDNSRMDLVDVDLRLNDDSRLYFGSSADAYFVWDDTNGTVDMVGNIDVTGTLTVSGAFDLGDFAFGDDEELRFGNSNDFVLHYDSSNANLEIDAAAANDQITFGTTVATDVRIEGGTYDIHWDASEDTLCFLDNAVLAFGNTAASPDVEIKWDSDSLNITGSALAIEVGADTAGMDIKLFSATTGNFIQFDANGNTNGGLYFEDVTLTMMDDTLLLFGDGSTIAGDFKMHSDGTDLFIQEVSAAGKNLKIGESGKGMDVFFYGDDAGQDMNWDQSEDALTFADSAYIKLGVGNDLIMSAAGTAVTFTMAAASTFVFADTDNAGSTFTFGTTGTNGLDVVLQSITASDTITFDAANKTLTFTDCSTVMGYDNNTVAYTTIVDSSDYLTLTATDTAAARYIIGSSAGTNSIDVYLQSGTAGDHIAFDGASKSLTFTDCSAVFGYDNNTVIYTLAADSNDYMTVTNTDDATARLVLGNHTQTNGMDIYINSVTSGEDIIFDAASKTLTFDGIDLKMSDDDVISFGDSAEATMEYDEDGDNDLVITCSGGIELAGAVVGTTTITATTGIQTLAVARTATVGGATTGLIAAGNSFVVVTCDTATKQITLPAAVPGTIVRIMTPATACELICTGATVKINDVTCGATNELQLVGDSHFICECLSSTEWIVRGFTKLGADIGALVPDTL